MDVKPQQGLPATLVVQNFIAGAPRSSDAAFERRNPANRDDVVTVAPLASVEQVAAACRAARAAQKLWARVPAPQRAQVIGRLGELLRAHKESLACFVSREMGKPLREALGSVQEASTPLSSFRVKVAASMGKRCRVS